MRLVQSVKFFFAALSAGMVLGGGCLLIWPDVSAAALCVAFGVVFLLSGVIRLIGYCSNDLYRLAFQFDLAVGLLLLVLGGMMVFHSRNVLHNLPLIVGVFVLTDSVLRLQTAIDAKHFGMKRWWGILLSALCGGALGALLLIRPFEGGRLLVRVLGGALLASGAENLLLGLYAIRAPRRASADPIEVPYFINGTEAGAEAGEEPRA